MPCQRAATVGMHESVAVRRHAKYRGRASSRFDAPSTDCGLYNQEMTRRIPIRDTARWTGIGLCAAILLTWSICSLIFLEPPRSPLGLAPGQRIPDDEVNILDYSVPALSIVGLLFFLLVLSPIPSKALSTHCRKCKYPLVGITSGRCPECGTIIPTFRPTSAAYLADAQTPGKPSAP